MTVKKQLFDCMDDLLQLDAVVPEMADVLTEVCILNRITAENIIY